MEPFSDDFCFLIENVFFFPASRADILTILTAVNQDVGSETNKTGTKKQMPLLASTLYKMVKFPVSKKMLPQTREFP